MEGLAGRGVGAEAEARDDCEHEDAGQDDCDDGDEEQEAEDGDDPSEEGIEDRDDSCADDGEVEMDVPPAEKQARTEGDSHHDSEEGLTSGVEHPDRDPGGGRNRDDETKGVIHGHGSSFVI